VGEATERREITGGEKVLMAKTAAGVTENGINLRPGFE